jgi:hypothetical protein
MGCFHFISFGSTCSYRRGDLAYLDAPRKHAESSLELRYKVCDCMVQRTSPIWTQMLSRVNSEFLLVCTGHLCFEAAGLGVCLGLLSFGVNKTVEQRLR